MTKNDQDRDVDFLENIARKAWLNMNYADAIELSLMEGQLSHLIVEKIEEEEVEKLESAAEDSRKRLEAVLATAEELGLENTVKYLQKLEGDLPSGGLDLVNLIFKGDPKKAAKETGKVTAVVNKIQAVEDSVKDAIVFLGTQLKKLPYAQAPKKTAEDAAAEAAKESESGEVEVDGEALGTPEDVAAEAETAFQEVPLRDLASNKFMTWAKGIQFPDTGTLEKAAKDSYKPPPEPEGFLGKLGGFFKMGELGAGNFADDIMGVPLSALIAAADKWSADAKEEPTPVGADIGADLQSLGKGDDSVVASPGASGGGGQGGQGGQGGGGVNVPGIGTVPVTPETVPGYDGSADKAGEMKAAPWSELEKTVTAPEDVAELTPDLAALINDDPKSGILFFDPTEAEEAAKETDSSEKPPPLKSSKKENWVHSRKMSDWLFEASETQTSSSQWVHKASLRKTLFTEAIFYKDVAKALKAQGIDDEKIPEHARDLAKRLKNQYDIVIEDLPEVEIEEEAVEAAEQIQQSGISMDDVKDLLKQQGESSKEAMQMVKDVLASKDESEVQRALARAKEQGVNVTNVLTATAESSSEAAAGAEGDAGEEEKAPGKKRDRTGPPSDKMKERGGEIGVKAKKGETGEQYGRRVRKEEEKQGKRKPKKKPSKKKPAKKSGSSSKAKSSASASAETKSESLWHEGTLLNSHLVHKHVVLAEILIGTDTKVNKGTEKQTELDRWAQLAGLEEE